MKNFNNFLNEVLVHPKYNDEDCRYIISYKKYIYLLTDDDFDDSERINDLLELLDIPDSYNDSIYDLQQYIEEQMPHIIYLEYRNERLYLHLALTQFSFDFSIYKQFIDTLKILKKELNVDTLEVFGNMSDLHGESEIDVAENFDIDDLINHFTKDVKVRKLPKFVYHGTCTAHLNNILSKGLRPDQIDSNFKNLYLSSDYIFLTSSIYESYFYAENAAYQTKSIPIILEISTNSFDINKISFDYDFYADFIGIGNEDFDSLASHKYQYDSENKALKHLHDKYVGATFRKFSYKGNIYPKSIKAINYKEFYNNEYYNNVVYPEKFKDFLDLINYAEDFYDNTEYCLDFEEYEDYLENQDED